MEEKKMTLKKEIEKIIKANTITESVVTVSRQIEQENSFEVLCNTGFVIDKILKLILKEVEKVRPKEKETLWHWIDFSDGGVVEGLSKTADEAPPLADGSSVEYVWNKALAEYTERIKKLK